ncbi:11212_t:CDS:1 [Ambispora gerdemannii]|uniref:11212_t:CDS:1 n=1 Tax=Ambispora gerdemannii TaxID=144530 RepID=A0A9N8VJZ2_9GLOM|nr:11212_t:CDS:1 [Ambispora gerdemannii]
MTPPLAETHDTQFESLTNEEFLRRVKEGQSLIIYDRKVYKLDNWIKFHPGGALAIHHLVGKDATDEINAFHPAYVYENKIHSFYVGEYADDSDFIVPSSTNEERKKILNAYRRLELTIRANKLYDCNYINYGYECIRYLLLITISWILVLHGTTTLHYLLSAVFLGAFWHQLAFTAHDAGHNGITHILLVDNLIGILIASYCGGLSIGWWKKNHYVHHIVTNDPNHDPDIQHLPFFAVSTKFFENLHSSFYKRTLQFDAFARFFIPMQHYLYYPVLCFGRFNLYFLSISYLCFDERVPFRKLELTGMLFFWTWFIYMLSFLPSWKIIIAFFLISHMVTVILHVQITLSHFGMSTELLGPDEPFPEKMLRTSMDVDCPWWMDWFHGGLQFQAIHHLFPRIPRHNLRACQPFVKKFCEETGLQYHIYGFVEGNGVVLSALKDVANQIELLSRVAAAHGDRNFVS